MIKNLLFDLGGVIMNIRRENAIVALEKLGMSNANAFLGEYVQKGPFLLLEQGAISAEDFRNEIRKYVAENITDSEIDSAFNKFLTGIPEQRLNDLLYLKSKGYNIYMLSNTNPIMWDSEIDRQFRKQGLGINRYFDGIVTSFEAKCCKPDPYIFKYALDKFGITASETLFMDDSQRNIDAAQKLGFKVALIKPCEEFITLFGS